MMELQYFGLRHPPLGKESSDLLMGDSASRAIPWSLLRLSLCAGETGGAVETV